jgi:ketosteroid isomerase-like protein
MDLDQVRQAIEENNAKFGEGFRQMNAQAIADLYTEDTILLPPNFDRMQGKMSIQTFWSGAIMMGVKSAVLST